MQGLLELIDQRGALFDERDFVAAEDAQLGDHRILGGQGAPAMAIESQGVGQRPGVVPVGLVAAGALALTVAFGVFRIDGINGHAAVEELFDGGTEAGFDGYPKVGEGGDFFLPLPPSCQGVLDAELGDDPALGVHDDDVVMVLCPVESGEVGQFVMSCHGLGCFGFPAGTPDPSTGRTDTMSFASLCSIRPWGWTSVRTGFLSQILKGLGVGDRIRAGAFPPPVGNRRGKVINRNLGCPGKVIHNRRRLGGGRKSALPPIDE